MYNIYELRLPECSKLVIGKIRLIAVISMKTIDKVMDVKYFKKCNRPLEPDIHLRIQV